MIILRYLVFGSLLNLTLKCCTRSCGLLRLDCHDFKLRQNLVDKVDNFRASIVAALAAIGVPKLHVAEEDVGQHGTKPLADILKKNNILFSLKTNVSSL